MKLPITLIFDCLAEQYPACTRIIRNPGLELERPVLYEPGMEAEPGRLYLAERGVQTICRKDTALICMEAPSGLSGNVLVVPAAPAAVLNRMQHLWDRYDEWLFSMEQQILERGSIQTLLRLSLPILDNPIFLTDADFSLKAEAGEELLPEKMQIYRDSVDNLPLFTALLQSDVYRRHRGEQTPFLTDGMVLPFRAWIVNLLRDGALSHQLVLAEYVRPLRQSDGWLLAKLTQCVEYLLEQEQRRLRSENSLHTIVRRLLSEPSAEMEEISRQLEQQGWSEQHRYLCAVFSLYDDAERSVDENRLRSFLEQKFEHCCCEVYREKIVCFFNLTMLGLSEETLGPLLTFFIRENILKAGYSRVYEGHSWLRRQYVQAAAALQIGTRRHPTQWIHHFGDLGLQYILERATGQLPGEMVCHEGLLRLRECDRAGGTAYVKTLRVYLDTGCNAVQTAKSLFIHRSTLLYRLDKIRQIIDSELTNADELLYLSVSLRMLDTEQSI